jgi:hypothetical protein
MFFKRQNDDITPPEPFHSRQFTIYGRDVRWLQIDGQFRIESGEYEMPLEGDETFRDIKEIVLGWISTS